MYQQCLLTIKHIITMNYMTLAIFATILMKYTYNYYCNIYYSLIMNMNNENYFVNTIDAIHHNTLLFIVIFYFNIKVLLVF